MILATWGKHARAAKTKSPSEEIERSKKATTSRAARRVGTESQTHSTAEAGWGESKHPAHSAYFFVNPVSMTLAHAMPI